MGFECSICGEQKGALAVRYPLDLDKKNFEICRGCDAKKENLRFYAGKNDEKEKYEKEREFFQSKMRENGGMRAEVREYLRDMIAKYDVSKGTQSAGDSGDFDAVYALPKGFAVSTDTVPKEMQIQQSLGIFSVHELFSAGIVFLASYDVCMEGLERTRCKTLYKLVQKAQQAGANGLVGVQFHFIRLDEGTHGVMATGTAVILEPETLPVL